MLHLAYVATPQDVQKSLFWMVRIRLAPPSTQQPTVANGTINVQHPPIDFAQVQSAVSALSAQAPARRAQAQSAAKQSSGQFAMQVNALLQQQRAELEQRRAQRHAALLAQAQPVIDRLRGAVPGTIVSRGIGNGDPNDVSSQVRTRSLPSGTMKAITPPASPLISSLSVAQGEPGDPVMISGSAFGTTAGQLHFVIAPGMDVVATDAIWTNAQIFATVPAPAKGVPAFNGTVYVKRADQVASNLIGFAFVPSTERRMISIPAPPADSILPRYPGDELGWFADTGLVRENSNMFWNPSGDDQFFTNTLLKNGWKVYAPPTLYAVEQLGLGGGAYLVSTRVGTSSPYADIHWWVDVGLGNFFGYGLVIPIEGPQGTADGVVVP